MNESTKEERIELNNNSEIEVYQKNKTTLKNKISILEFALTTTKIDLTFEALEGYLYWGGLTEFFLWFILIGLFISDVQKMKIVWFFLFHIPRGTIGLIILSSLPKTYEALTHINQIESNDLEEIKKQIIDDYVNIVLSKEKVLKPLLISYFVLTLVSVIIDILLFGVITPDFGTKNRELTFLIVFFAVICFIVQDFIFLLFFSSFKYTFPPEQNKAIRKAVMGFFTQLKVVIAVGFTNIAKTIGRNSNPHANNQNENKPHMNNDSNNPIDVNKKEVNERENPKDEVKSMTNNNEVIN